ncbi:MAG: hypothetical protein WCS34_06770 [Bacteroidales bacterium]
MKIKKTITKLLLSVTVLSAISLTTSSCEGDISETPDINDGYQTTIVLPEAPLLTDEERAIVDAMFDEYDQAIESLQQ